MKAGMLELSFLADDIEIALDQSHQMRGLLADFVLNCAVVCL
jgi:hypothetical protein